MMTNVDYEGFNDWTDTELEEAIATIKRILESRKNEKINRALDKIGNAMAELQNTKDDIDYFDFKGSYTLADIFETLRLYYKERMA